MIQLQTQISASFFEVTHYLGSDSVDCHYEGRKNASKQPRLIYPPPSEKALISLPQFLSCQTSQPLQHSQPLNSQDYFWPPILKVVPLYLAGTGPTVGLNIDCVHSVPRGVRVGDFLLFNEHMCRGRFRCNYTQAPEKGMAAHPRVPAAEGGC